MKAQEIAEKLADRTEDVVRMLLPNAKKKGAELQVGSINGEAGKSLCIHTRGSKAGVWNDFADNAKGGDLLDLWQQVCGLSMADAIQEAKSYLGIRDELPPKKKYTKPEKPKCTTPKNRVVDYLTVERNLKLETLSAYKIAEQNDFIVFPSIREGELIRYKLRHVDDKHKCQTSSDSEPCLFGWQAIPETAREVVICEGEIDALSWFQLGYPALSVPSGAQSLTWIDAEYGNLERFDKIHLSMDMDDAGQSSVGEIIERLGRDRVRVVELPCKDANDYLCQGKTDARHIIARAKTVDPKELRSASEFTQEVIHEFYSEDIGFRTPWQKVDKRLLFRKGEVIVFAGINKHGKSQAVGHITLDAIAQGEKACIASLEFKPAKWLKRLTRQASCVMEPAHGYIEAVHRWYEDKLWVFDVVGNGKSKRMLSVFKYARQRYGVTTFVIDNLQKLDIALDDYDKQKEFVDELTDFAKEFDCTVFLVHHMRKGADESKVGKMDIKGSGAITDMVDTIIVWWRNKKKEAERRKALHDGVPFDEGKEPDAMLYCEGQRNGEEEPKVRLWFDSASTQFLENHYMKPRRYVTYTVVKNEVAA